MRVLFRADGNTQIGLGHLYRCATLANALKDNWTCCFFSRTAADEMPLDISRCFSSIEQLSDQLDYQEEAVQWAKHINKEDIVVLDGYHFKTDYQKQILTSGCRLVCIDDLHAWHSVADIIINHAGNVSPSDYNAESYTQFYLGPPYTLVREEFSAPGNKSMRRNDQVMICLGGADPNNDTVNVLEQALAKAPHLNYVIVTGKAYKQKEALQQVLSIHKNATHQHALSTTDLILLMQQSGVAICSPSTVSLEYIHVGGELYLHQTADNQKDIYTYCVEAQLAFPFSAYRLNQPAVIENALLHQKKIFDGQAAQRLRKLVAALALMQHISIGRAEELDLEQTYSWANDAEVRKMSYSNASISFAEHTNWFLSKISDHTNYYYIMKATGNEPVAQLRLEKKESVFLLSYTIDAKYRGRGLGSFILAEGLKQFRKEVSGDATVVGYVKKENKASCISFERMKFKKEETVTYKDSFKYTIQL